MVEMFKALGDPTRLQIVRMLSEQGDMCVCHIVETLKLGQPAISHHMSVLKNSGLVNSRREGQWIHYSLNREAIKSGPCEFLNSVAAEKINSGKGCCSNE